MKTLYTVELHGYYITNLYSDNLKETFSSQQINDNVYKWRFKETAEMIAKEYAGSKVIEII